MKSVSFQRNKSLIRVVNEDKIRKSRNWDRIIYLILLALFLFFLVYYIVHKSLYVHANGQVLLESLSIRLTDDARILDFNVNEGDSVRVNDTLFAYATDTKDNGNGGGGGGSVAITNSNGSEADTWWWKEVYNLKKKIAMNDIEIARNNSLVQSYQGELRRITNEVILDVLPKSRLEQIKGEITTLLTDNEKLRKENGQLAEMMSQLGPSALGQPANTTVNYGGGKGWGGGNGANKSLKYNFSGEYLTPPKFFLSPIDGIITRLYLHQYETALKSETVIAMHKNYNLTIKAFFDQENLQDVREGDIFKIEFPDGTESMGVLKRFYFATYAMPEEFQKKYEPTTRAISADIYPLNDEEAKKWKAFYKMSVEISKFKY